MPSRAASARRRGSGRHWRAGGGSAGVTPGDAHDVLAAVVAGQAHLHLLAVAGGEVLADVVGPDRQLAVTPVDEYGQPHGARTTEVGQGVEGGPDGAPGVEHVVDEHDDLVVDTARRDRGVHRRPGGLVAQVVAVHRDVEAPDGHLGALDLTDQVGETVGQLDAAAGDAEQDEVVGTLVVLEDLVRDATQRPGHVARGEHGTTGRV